jgi:hypothetical protein
MAVNIGKCDCYFSCFPFRHNNARASNDLLLAPDMAWKKFQEDNEKQKIALNLPLPPPLIRNGDHQTGHFCI